MDVFQTLGATAAETDRLRQWLLNRKQTQNWDSPPSAAQAIHSLLGGESSLLEETNSVTVRWGDKTLRSSDGEAATGYIRESVGGKDLDPSLHTLSLHKEGTAPAWGAVYCQYFESVGNVSKQGSEAISIEKKLFVETGSGAQRSIAPAGADRPLRTGDKVVVRLTVRTDRTLEYVCLKDLRAGCFEPAARRSGIRSSGGLLYYHAPRDVSEHFFFNRLPAGTHVLEYAVYVSRSGQYSGGIATLQCQYAPGFAAHTQGDRLTVLP
jgi:uncharacterized protein YfaS (alpha-2-macroglobulin family)